MRKGKKRKGVFVRQEFHLVYIRQKHSGDSSEQIVVGKSVQKSPHKLNINWLRVGLSKLFDDCIINEVYDLRSR